MCAVSMTIDYGIKTWPDPNYIQMPPVFPQPVVPESTVPTPDQWKIFIDLVEVAREYDRRTKQPNCEDPEKVAWMTRMDERMDRIEKLLQRGDR